MTDLNLAPQFKYSTLLYCKIEESLVHIEKLEIYQFTEMINMFRVGTPQPFFEKLNTMVHDRLEIYTTL